MSQFSRIFLDQCTIIQNLKQKVFNGWHSFSIKNDVLNMSSKRRVPDIVGVGHPAGRASWEIVLHYWRMSYMHLDVIANDGMGGSHIDTEMMEGCGARFLNDMLTYMMFNVRPEVASITGTPSVLTYVHKNIMHCQKKVRLWVTVIHAVCNLLHCWLLPLPGWLFLFKHTIWLMLHCFHLIPFTLAIVYKKRLKQVGVLMMKPRLFWNLACETVSEVSTLSNRAQKLAGATCESYWEIP